MKDIFKNLPYWEFGSKCYPQKIPAKQLKKALEVFRRIFTPQSAPCSQKLLPNCQYNKQILQVSY